jgi:hypothetical protein
LDIRRFLRSICGAFSANQIIEPEKQMKLSVKSLILAGALLEGLCFLFVTLFNLILPPYGGAYLAMMMSLYPGYNPAEIPLSIVIGVLYAVISGGVTGALFGWLYNAFVARS